MESYKIPRDFNWAIFSALRLFRFKYPEGALLTLAGTPSPLSLFCLMLLSCDLALVIFASTAGDTEIPKIFLFKIYVRCCL
jgi:hypothetical protein